MLRSISLAAACFLLVAACEGESRPSAHEWRPAWESARQLVPDAATVEEEGAELCGEFLGEVRQQRDEMTPAPNDAIGDAFKAWAEEAESLGLDCGSDTEEDLDERIGEIDELADQVDRALAAA